MFGALFNDIYVLRKDSAGKVISQVKVPLSYGPSSKFIQRINENTDLDTDTKVAIKLPRMSFEIVSFNYDTSRQLQKTNSFTQNSTNANLRNKFYSYVPYNISFQLSVYAKTQDDALQVVEQIIPYFNPQYTLTVKPFDDFQNIKEDVPVVLTGVDFQDDYEGSLEQRRTLIYTLTFDMKVNFHGPILERGVVRTAINNIFDQGSGLQDSDYQLSKLTVTTDPADASPDDDYGFSETLDNEAPFE